MSPLRLRSARVVTGLAAAAMMLVAVGPGAAASSARPGSVAAQRGNAPDLTLDRQHDHAMANMRARGNITESYSTPAVGDITGDGHPDTVTAGMDGLVVARRADGSVIWQKNYDNWGVQSSPVIVDVQGNGSNDVVIGLMGGTVVWVRGSTGNVVKSFANQPPRVCTSSNPYCKTAAVFGTPVVTDITGDGRNDIIATNWDHQVYAWRQDGSVIFRKYLLDTVWASPVVADIDRDGRPEIIVAGTLSYRTGAKSPGGYIWILRRDGSDYPGYPKRISNAPIWSTPAAVDLTGNRQLDLVFGTGGDSSHSDARRVYAINARTGSRLPGWSIAAPGRVDASPSIGDVDGDGKPDVVFASEGGYVQAHRADGSLIWRACNAWGVHVCGTGNQTHGSAIIADLNGDGATEVVSALDKHLRVFQGTDGSILSDQVLEGYQQPTVFATAGSASVATFDSEAVILQNALVDTSGDGRRGRGDTFRTWVWSVSGSLGASPWPTFKHDMARSGKDASATETWAPFDTPRAFVAQQYRDFLNRESDPGGLAYWTNDITSFRASGAKIAEQHLRSHEFTNVIAPVVRLSMAATGRPPQDLASTRSRIDQFRTDGLLEPIAADVISESSLHTVTDRTFVATVYQYIYRRPAPAAVIDAESARLAGGQSRQNWLVGQVTNPFGVAATQNGVFVAMSYMGMLQRLPDLPGYQYWVRQVDGGISIRKLVSLHQFGSEYVARFS